MDNFLWIGLIGAVVALVFAYLQRGKVMACSEGNDKMQKIAEALGMDYFEFVGPVGKFSSLNPNRPIPHLNGMLPGEISDSDKHLLDLYHNATSDAQTSVMILLEHSQKEKTPSEEI